MGEPKEILIIYDGNKSNAQMRHAMTNKEGLKEIDMTGHESAIIINLTNLRKKRDSIPAGKNHTKKETAELLNITPRTVQYYTDFGLLEPAENPKGRGKTRKYSIQNIWELLLISAFTQHGFTLDRIKELLEPGPFSIRYSKMIYTGK